MKVRLHQLLREQRSQFLCVAVNLVPSETILTQDKGYIVVDVAIKDEDLLVFYNKWIFLVHLSLFLENVELLVVNDIVELIYFENVAIILFFAQKDH